MVQLGIRTLFYLSLFPFILSIEIKGQEDTIIDRNPTLINSTVGKDNQIKQNYLDENLREEKALFKLYIYPYLKFEKTMKSYGGFSSSIAYERKIIPSLSFLISNEFGFQFSEIVTSWSSVGNFELRYYYSVRKKIKESTGANNFHNNYFGVGLKNLYSYQHGNVKNYVLNGYLYNYKSGIWSFDPILTISWGMQRRIKKWGFYDIEPYIGFANSDYGTLGLYYGINFKLGLAWGF